MEKLKLTDICDFQGGSQPPKEQWTNELKDGYIRMLQIRDFTQGKNENEYVKISNTLKTCEDDDILIARYGASVGKVLSGLSGAYNVAIIKSIPDISKVLKKYLYYYFNTDYFQNRIKSVGSRAAQAGFNKTDLKDFEIGIPSLIEQQKIIEILDKSQELIKKRKEQIEALDELVKSKFIEMFGDPVQNPLGWQLKPFLDSGNCKNGMNFSATETGVELQYLGVGDFKDLSKIEDVNNLGKVSLNKMPSTEYLLQDGDIVFVRSNGNKALVGRCLAVYPNGIPTTYSGFCIRYRKTDKSLEIPYLLQVLKTDSMRKNMAGRGANIQNLNQQILGELMIPIPPIELQNQFADFVKQVDKLKFEMEKSLKELEDNFNSLMQKAFKGELFD